nr:hypothetical protein [Tanacetum cinerariifolium]
MGKTSKFFKSLFGFQPSDKKRRGWTLFKSSYKQLNHETYDMHQTVSRPSDTPLHYSNNQQTVATAAANVVVAEDAILPHGANVEAVIHRGAWVVTGWLLGGDVVVKVASKVLLDFSIHNFYRNVKGIVDITEFNLPGVKLFSLSKPVDTFSRLQALSNLHYVFGGFLYYLWSRELDISNFGQADRLKAYLRVFRWFFYFVHQSWDDMSYSCLIEYPKHFALTARIWTWNDCHDLR